MGRRSKAAKVIFPSHWIQSNRKLLAVMEGETDMFKLPDCEKVKPLLFCDFNTTTYTTTHYLDNDQ